MMSRKNSTYRAILSSTSFHLHFFIALTSTAYALASAAGPGLQNLGNTCYLNAQLQAAFHIPRVRQLVQTAGADTSSLQVTPYDEIETTTCSPALTALAQLFREMDSNNGQRTAVSPRRFCGALGIPVMEQQDSQEFWKLLLPTIQLPALTKLYAGKLESYIRALDGSGRQRSRPEPFLDLSLDLPSNGGGSVEESLHKLLREPELLSTAEGNGWRPEKGADPIDAHKGAQLTRDLPSVLQLHLKRFQFDWQTETMSKRNDPLTFPRQLNLPMETEEDDENSMCAYELQAVVVHAGEYGSGHYYAYVRPDVREGSWFRFNDQRVDEVAWNDVVCDGYGGPQEVTVLPSKNPTTNRKKKFLSRLLRIFRGRDFQGASTSYGYGGQTSSAYVLQYVRRCDIPDLYGQA